MKAKFTVVIDAEDPLTKREGKACAADMKLLLTDVLSVTGLCEATGQGEKLRFKCKVNYEGTQ